MSERILVINPNSTEAVTRAIDRSVAPLRIAGGPAIDCVTLAEGPPGVESQADVDGVVGPMTALAQREAAAAYVIACYSDPGLFTLRETLSRPVFGIAECSMLRALTLGERFGIIAILPASIVRQRRMVRQMALAERYAGSRALGIGVVEAESGPDAFERIVATGAALREQDGADVLILGCAGMADHRARLEDHLRCPVVEPTQAATAMALGAVCLHRSA